MREDIAVLTDSLPLWKILSEVPELKASQVKSEKELINLVLANALLSGVLIQHDNYDRHILSLIDSLYRSFPFLKICCIMQLREEEKENGIFYVNPDQPFSHMVKKLRNYCQLSKEPNKRQDHRIDWPLKAYLSLNTRKWSCFDVHSLGSGGAFLLSSDSPEKGVISLLRISFLNYEFHCSCRVLNIRENGFAVQFFNLSELGRKVLLHIINDALLQVLLQPDLPVQTPELDDYLLEAREIRF